MTQKNGCYFLTSTKKSHLTLFWKSRSKQADSDTWKCYWKECFSMRIVSTELVDGQMGKKKSRDCKLLFNYTCDM